MLSRTRRWLDDHLAADLLADLIEVDAVTGQGFTELLQCHAVAGGNLLHRLVERGIIDGNAGTFAHLQLDALQNQAVNHLRAQLALGWCRGIVLGELLAHGGHAFFNLAGHDHVVIDDRGNAIQRFYGGLGCAAEENARAQAKGRHQLKMHYLHALCNRGYHRQGGCPPHCRSHCQAP